MTTDDSDLDFEEFDDLDEAEETTKKKATSKSKKAAKPKGIGASAVAEKLGCNPKTFRAWLRRKVEAGDVTVTGHDVKARYTWPNWKDPELVAIMKAYKTDPHERGGGRKKKAAPAKKKAASTKRRRRKAPAK